MMIKKEKQARNTPTAWFILFVALTLCANSFKAQVIYNGYASVTNISGTTFTVGNVNETNHAFAAADGVVIMQMQDDVIGTNTTNVSTFGDLGASGIKKAGLWEVAKIASVTRTSGILKTVTFSASLINTYTISANASVQLITFRYLSSSAFTSSANITGLAWDGTLGIGGVIALQVQTVFTLGHNISADALGFAGGVKNPTQFASTSCDATFVTSIGNKWAGKGEGIYKTTDPTLLGARGHLLTGGGGGTDENSGGGGGGNYAAGGQGGPGYNGSSTGCSPGVGGLGGISLSSVISGSRVFMGGGGGGGHENNNVGTIGGRGGGIILLKTGTLTTSGSCGAISISANGETSGSAGNDAAGGGGAAGSIVLQIQQFTIANTCSLNISANGGSGGSVNYSQAHGAGGGGGQGVVIYSIAQPTTNMSTSTSNGSGGCNDNNVPCTNAASTPTQAGNSGIKASTSSPLPVGLAKFTAVKSDDHSLLQWTTLTEHKNSYFDIMRTGDGQVYETLATVYSLAKNGNSNSVLNYSYVDKEPLEGINYYQLKQVDVDGTSEYSPMVSVNCSHFISKNAFVVYPNPTNGDVFLKMKDVDLKDLEINLSLRDASGREINSRRITDLSDNAPIALFQGLQKGYYILNIKTNYQEFNSKLIVN